MDRLDNPTPQGLTPPAPPDESSGTRSVILEQAAERPQAFISYPRTSAPLVQDLVRELDANGITVFVDYRDLVFGQPWHEQFVSGVARAETFVLVVTNDSVNTSKYCRDELAQAQLMGKRVILAIAEPVRLPPDLESREWVDLRKGRFGKRVAELSALIQQPASGSPEARPPRFDGRPLAVWIAITAAVVALPFSLALAPTIVVPLTMLALPVRIFRRTFRYANARAALAIVAFCFFDVSVALDDSNSATRGQVLAFLGTVLPLLALMTLRSSPVRRWMRPPAASPRVPAIKPVDEARTPKPRRFAIRNAPEDEAYRREIVDALLARGHVEVPVPGPVEADEAGSDPPRPDLVLQLVSRFNDTEDLPRGVLALPILVSDADDEMPSTLQETQWLDFRAGSEKRRALQIRHLAAELDAPEMLVENLGTMPPYGTRVLPRRIQALHDLITLSLIAAVPFAVLVLSDERYQMADRGVSGTVLGAVACVLLAIQTRRILAGRLPRRRFGLYMPAMIVCFMAMWGGGNQEVDSGLDLLDPGKLAWYLVGLAIFALPAGWLATLRVVRAWIPKPQPADRSPEARTPTSRSDGSKAAGGRPREAQAKVDPDGPFCCYKRGRAKADSGDWNGAIADYDEAIAQYSDCPDFFIARGAARQAIGERAGALTDQERAAALQGSVAALS